MGPYIKASVYSGEGRGYLQPREGNEKKKKPREKGLMISLKIELSGISVKSI